MRHPELEKYMNQIPVETKIFAGLYADIVVRIHDILESKKLSQKDLAEKLNKRPSEISKWLNDSHNLTLKTIAKLEAVLQEPIINVPVKKEFVSKGKNNYNYNTSFTVFKNNHKPKINSNKEQPIVSKVRITA